MIAAVFVKLVAQRLQPHQRILRLANLITLSRVVSAALLAGTAAAPRVGRRTALLALLWGGPSDWIDGPVARGFGRTQLGAVLDIEADSWLTLWAAVAAWRTEGLAAICLVSPVARYVIPWLELRHQRQRPQDHRWQRIAASAQTLALILALSPSRRCRRWARLIGPSGACAQLVAMGSTARSVVWNVG